MADYKLSIGDPVPAAELIKQPSTGRKPNPRDEALTEFVRMVADPANKANAYPWDYGEEKPLTARAAAVRAIARAEATDKVFASSREGKIWFSQTKLSNRGRSKK